MRQLTPTLRVTMAAWACSALLAACGGGGDDSSGTNAQSIDFPYPGARRLATAPAPLNATATSGLAVSFSSNTPTTCTVTDGRLVPLSEGECSITATQAGSADYAAAMPAQQLFMILKHSQAITFDPPAFLDINLPPAPLAASADSGLAVSLVSTTPEVCAVSGTTLTLVSRGSCTITASQPGDVNYAAATPVIAGITVADAPPPVLTLLSGYKSTSSTNEDGSISTAAGSNKDGWWCSDPNWCGSAISADGSNFTYHYWIQPNDPNHPNGDSWIGGYFNVEAVVAGVGSISTTSNTTTGVQVDKQTSLKFGLAQNTEWFSTRTTDDATQPASRNRDVRVLLILGHFALKDSNACNVAVSTTFTPKAAQAQSYELKLADFTTVSEGCGMTGLNASAELKAHPIVKIKFEAVQVNTSVVRTPDTYPTELTLNGSVTVQ